MILAKNKIYKPVSIGHNGHQIELKSAEGTSAEIAVTYGNKAGLVQLHNAYKSIGNNEMKIAGKSIYLLVIGDQSVEAKESTGVNYVVENETL